MTTPQGPGGPRPQGPAGPGPSRPTDTPQLSAAAIVAEINTNPRIREIADSLPDLSPSVRERMADIWRRNVRRVRTHLDRAA